MKKTSLLAITLLLFTMSLPVIAEPSSALSIPQWVQVMNLTPTPAIGCWIASYPSVSWLETACATYQSGPLVVGNGVADNASSINYSVTGATGIFTSESGYTSESDSIQGTGWYSLQLNANKFSTTVGSCSTTGGEQFLFNNQGAGNYNGYISIQFWLQNCSPCPTGWNSYGGNCFVNSPSKNYGYINPSSLTSYTLTGTVSSTGDSSKLCYTTTGNCIASTDSDRLGLYNGKWWSTEYNVFGYGSQSTANFNTGISIGVKINNFQQGQTCGSRGITLETNNMNLGPTCTGGSNLQYITFTESH